MKLNIGTYMRPFLGERVTGDAVLTLSRDHFTYLVVIDGIGHGQKAHEISTSIKSYIKRNLIPIPSELIKNTHNYMKGSEGAVIGVSIIDHKASTLSFGGLGNISCKVISIKKNVMVSADGLLGVRFRSIKNSKVTLKNKDLIVMHSDGVSSTSEMSDLLEVNSLSSRLLAKKIVLAFGSDFDDASCIIAKCITE
jgi:hypothetical protein